MRAILCDQSLIIDDFIDRSFELNLLDSLSELEGRFRFLDSSGRRVASSDYGDSCVSGKRRLEDLSELRVSVGDVGSARARNRSVFISRQRRNQRKRTFCHRSKKQ